MVNFFDAAQENRRNSVILVAAIFFIFILLVSILSMIFRLGICGPILGFFALLFYTVVVYYQGDQLILAMTGAKEATSKDYPFLYNIVEGMAIASNIPMPKIYVILDNSPNAFATGRDPQHSSIAVSTGLLSIMKREELEGVVAHEISHIANYDSRFSMLAIVFVGAIALISEFALRIFLYGGSSRDRRGGSGALMLIGLVFVVLAPIFVQLLRFAISREREYLADSTGAKITRYPEGLASALEKIKKANLPTKSANDTTATLFFSNPFPDKMGFLGSTHPPIEDRIKRLRSM